MAANSPVSVRFEDDSMDSLKRFAEKTGVSMSEAIRQFVENGLRLAEAGESGAGAGTGTKELLDVLENTSLVTLQNLFTVKAALRTILTVQGDEPWLAAEKNGLEELNRLLAGE